MRQLAISECEFLNLILKVTETTDCAVYVDAGANGTFTGQWLAGREYGLDVATLKLQPTDVQESEWLASRTVLDAGARTYTLADEIRERAADREYIIVEFEGVTFVDALVAA